MDWHGVKMAVTHFVMQFTHVSRHFWVYSREKKMFRENCFENEGSDLTKNSLYVHKTILEKMQKVKTKNHENILSLWRILGTKLVLLVNFWDHIFKTVFPKKKFCFLLKIPKCLEICVNCVTKGVTAKIYPIKVWILQTIFFKVTLHTI